MDWDDLRFVLAVVRSGSALGAAKALGVNQTTVTRRIAHVEETLGQALFERAQGGYQATALGRRAAETAERMECEVQAFASQLQSDQRALAGHVRLTAAETIANGLLGPYVFAFRQKHPNVRVELLISDARVDLAHGEADVAVRAGSRPEGAGIVARRIAMVGWGVYCGAAYAEVRGAPGKAADISCHDIVGLDGAMAKLPQTMWLEAQGRPEAVSFRSNSLTNLVSSLRSGLGLGALPCFVGDGNGLVRCMGPLADLNSEMWLVVREEVKAASHIRAFADGLFEFLAGQRAMLSGMVKAAAV